MGDNGGQRTYTAQIPVREDGSIETGSIEAQADLTFSNLKRTLELPGAHLRTSPKCWSTSQAKSTFRA